MEAINSAKELKIDKYDDLCKDHFQIETIVPLKVTPLKLFLNIIVNLFTGGLIQFIFVMYPKTKKKICYSPTSIEDCEILAIHCLDGQLYFIKLEKITLPKIENPDLLIPEINYSTECYLFTFKEFTYVFNPRTNCFNSIQFNIVKKDIEIKEEMSYGLTEEERRYQRAIYGECDLNFYIAGIFSTIFNNMCDLFFFFQVYAILLWCFTDFLIYACVVAVLVIYNLLEKSITIRNNLINIRKMSKYSIDINLYSKNKKNFIEPSSNLVPGDVFELPEDGKEVPCDCILLSGHVIVNEAMLTGESTPIIKTCLPPINDVFDSEEDKKYMLFSGTTIVQKRPENKQPIICLCYSTGFNTVRGNLIRSVLYPKKENDNFMNESLRALKMVSFVFMLGFIIICSKKCLVQFKSSDKDEGEKKSVPAFILDLILELADSLTQVIPPELPLCLSICLSISQTRCKNKNIICINRDKINSAGKINACVFDKTGTLTKDHLENKISRKNVLGMF